ncbi:MAG: hypothetical protein B6D70_11510, partial [gamma proteobacterium symbiont of Stewartia floridana]
AGIIGRQLVELFLLSMELATQRRERLDHNELLVNRPGLQIGTRKSFNVSGSFVGLSPFRKQDADKPAGRV